jgi:arylsulfatase A
MLNRLHPSLLFVVTLVILSTFQVHAAEKPNIVFILADDLGWSELGSYGNHFNETPHLDQLANEGVRFTQAYASAPVCSPYRAALLTGQYPARIGILDYLRPNSSNALPVDQLTLPEMLQQQGYATGMVGKWHLTGYEHHGAEYEVKPHDHGFDWDIAREVKGVGNGANFWPYEFRDQQIRWLDLPENLLGESEFIVDRMNLEAVDFMRRNQEQPFFLYLSHYAPHSILNGKPDLVEKYRQKHQPGKSTKERCYLCEDQGYEGDTLNHWAGDHNPHLAAMLERIDHGVGMILKTLDDLGLAENTIVIFTSDNGGETNVTSNSPLRGGKSELYEGGLRVPLIVRWPGQIPEKTICDGLTMNVDFYPTILDVLGVNGDSHQKLDGVSILPLWKTPKLSLERDPLYWHYPLDQPHFLGGRSAGAIRDKDWKLIEFFDTGETELYALSEDSSEQEDLSAAKPKVVSGLKSKLQTWRTSINARMPSAPMLTRPQNLFFSDHFSAGQESDRWHFTKDWAIEKGVLRRVKTGSEDTRMFLKDAQFRNAVIRFDFQFQESKNLRLVTGSNGHYNAVVHLHRDHFFIQTAQDKSGPYFSRRHGECAFDFDPDRWYTLTVEFLGDELVAHIDADHVVYAKHPILDQERTYLAFQVDDSNAAFDNLEILNAEQHAHYEAGLKHVLSVDGQHPVQIALEERLKIEKVNARDRLYQSDAQYRQLFQHVEELDARQKQEYPDAFRSHKEFTKKIQEIRKDLHENDPQYKELLFTTHRAKRALDNFLIEQEPFLEELPKSRKPKELERIRQQYLDQPGYQELVQKQSVAQRILEKTYPQIFVSDEEIKQIRQERRDEVEQEEKFRKLKEERAAAYRAEQNYLTTKDQIYFKLQQQLD